MYLFDTNVVAALRFPDRQPPELRAWASRIDFVDCFLSIITRMEIEIGVQRLERRDPCQAAPLPHWLDLVLWPLFKSRILPVDERVALVCAPLHVPDPSPERDALIAAAAMVRDLTVASGNTRDFQELPVAPVDPWQAG